MTEELKIPNLVTESPLFFRVIYDEKFLEWTGSGSPEKHHYGSGGLYQHTYEVISLCFSTMATLKLNVNPLEIFFSALYHDMGKTFAYKKVPFNGDVWEKDIDFIRKIGHVAKSAMIWTNAWETLASKELKERDPGMHDRVLHNILSHHGPVAWGSIVPPDSREAWLLHLCDNMSARMNDADTFSPFYK